MKDVYLHPFEKNDYMVAIFLYGLIAVFILLLASVNFINLTTANSATRAKEIGVKKVNGSSRQALIWQFLSESVIIALFAINVAFVIAKLFLPVFSRIINRELQFSYQEHSGFILMLLGIAVIVGLLSGIYPALYLSS
jgi:putative ABC transport system permease protein